MRWLRAIIIGLVFWGIGWSSDTLFVNLVQPTVQHKDTVEYWFNSGVSAVFFDDLRDSIALYHPKVLNLWIYTYGGDPLVAIDFYYWLKSKGIKIRTFVGGMAASAGVLLFSWGDERYISPQGLLFVHQVSTWVFLEKYNPNSSKNMAITLETIQNAIEDFICQRTGINREKLHLWMVEEKWFTGKEAIEAGFANGMIGVKGIKPIKRFNSSDFRQNDAP